MRKSAAINWLVPLVGLLSLFASSVGLFGHGTGSPIPFTTVHGVQVLLAGQGLYAYDTLFAAATSRGTDLVTLFFAIPLLAVAWMYYHRGTLAGGLLLAGVMAYFLYLGASMGLGAAYNNLFLVYIALFSASFYGFILALTGINPSELSARLVDRFPRRGMGIFMIIVGIGLAFIWLSDVVMALILNQPPVGLGPYTTIVTYTIDIGIIAVACIIAGIQLLKKVAFGYVLGTILNLMLAMVGVMVIGQTIIQLSSGIQLTPGELIGKVTSFVIMGGIAIWFSIILFRRLSNSNQPQK